MNSESNDNNNNNNNNDDIVNMNDNSSINVVVSNDNSHHNQQQQQQSTIKSIESRQSVKIILHNQSTRRVTITWIDYGGNERIYAKLHPNCKFVIDSYVTHPWIFRDIERKNLAIFDAIIANRRDLLAFQKWNKYSEQKRFHVADRILFPKQHKKDSEFILVIIKNGVHNLQELCQFSLIEQLHRSSTSSSITLPSYILNNLPKHLCEILHNYIDNGQSLLEFLPL